MLTNTNLTLFRNTYISDKVPLINDHAYKMNQMQLMYIVFNQCEIALTNTDSTSMLLTIIETKKWFWEEKVEINP